jgi:hypothetical protein
MYKSVRYIGVRGWYCSCLIGVTHFGFDININEVICLLLVCLETVNCSMTRGTEPPLRLQLDILCEVTTPIRHPNMHMGVLPTVWFSRSILVQR